MGPSGVLVLVVGIGAVVGVLVFVHGAVVMGVRVRVFVRVAGNGIVVHVNRAVLMPVR
jgi:hypothetical protein